MLYMTAIGAGLLAVSIEKIVYSPLRKRNAPSLYFLISAMGASIFLENMVIASPIGPTFRSYPAIFSTTPIMIGNTALSRIDLLMFIISLISLILLIFIIEKTKVGLSIRATAFSIKGSKLMGVNVDKVIFIIFLLGGLLAGIAGMLWHEIHSISANGRNNDKIIYSGFWRSRSLPGAVIGSTLLG